MRLGVRQKLVLLSLLILVVVSFTFTAVQLDLTRTWREEDLRDRAVIFAGAVAARFSLNRFDAREARSRTVAFWLTAISVLVMGLLMTLAVHGVVNRPIERFVRAMRGAEAEPVAVTSNDEFGALARRFNDMIARAREQLFAMQRDLSHAERLALSGRIVAEVAHEVGTPLHSVMGHLELLREDLPAAAVSETIERRLGVIESQLGRLREIIDRLLDLTRRSPQPAVPVDVTGLVQETVELVRPAVAAARPELSVEGPPRGPAPVAPPHPLAPGRVDPPPQPPPHPP